MSLDDYLRPRITVPDRRGFDAWSDSPRDPNTKHKKAEAALGEERRLLRLNQRMDMKLSNAHAAARHIERLPGPEESLHLITMARFDFADFIPAILDLAAPAVALEFFGSTWALADENGELLGRLFDQGRLRRIGLITGSYFKVRSTPVFCRVYEMLRERGQRFAAAGNHAKLIAMRMDDGSAYILESSANFTKNQNIENHVLTNSVPLFEFHKAWMAPIVGDFAQPLPTLETALKADGGLARKRPKSARRLRIAADIQCARSSAADRDAFIREKIGPAENWNVPAAAAALAELIRRWTPIFPDGSIVVSAPQGASSGERHYATELARAVAALLGLPFRQALERLAAKTERGVRHTLSQAPFRWTAAQAPLALIIDDIVTTGQTLRLAIDAARKSGTPAFGFGFVAPRKTAKGV